MASNFSDLPDSLTTFLSEGDPDILMGPRCFQGGGKDRPMLSARLMAIEIEKLREEYRQRLDEVQQEVRCNMLRIIGVPEDQREAEDTTMVVLDIVQRQLGIRIRMADVQACYRTGSKCPRHIVVRFTTTDMRDEVLREKALLKGTEIMVIEELSPDRVKLFKDVTKHFGRKNVYVENGIIKVSLPGKCQRLRFRYSSDFEKYLGQ